MSKLQRYREKRDFDKTPEPSGGDKQHRAHGRFVIQEHDATRLHWDLRLEHDGVLASWAVPNGIPREPRDNRKAVHTEDHPLEYLHFEGDIPEGSYGAGTMWIWDQGTYELHKWEPKKVVVTLHGDRVTGRYALFQAGSEKDWLIHRMDPAADPSREPMPDRLVPMLAKEGALPRDEADYAFEIKWDGIRALFYYEPGRLRIESRNLNDITSQYPELRRLGRQLGARDAVLDGEIVALDDRGRPSFERLQQRMHLTRESEIKRRAQAIPATYIVFDVLYLEGRSLLGLPYTERRKALEALELEGKAWRAPRHHQGDGTALLEASVEQGLEGVVAKKLDSPYLPGRRSAAWIKVKHRQRQELVIAGWLPEQGRAERVGALLVGYHDEEGRLHYAGRVGTGFNQKDLAYLEKRLRPLRRDRSPFVGRRGPRAAVYAEPELVAEVEFGEWTSDGLLRAPSFKGLCELDAREVVLQRGGAPGLDGAVETTGDMSDGSSPSRSPGKRSRPARERPATHGAGILSEMRTLPNGAVEVTVEERPLRLSNLDKVMYPSVGFTKRDLVEYYMRVAPVLLPHLRGRPLTLKRYPDGVEGQHFYEKQCPSHRPPWVQTAAIWSRHNKRTIDFCLVNDLPTLVWAANLADLELHTSLSLAEEVSKPTMMVFDLDPGPPADIVQCSRVGLWLRDLFAQLGLEAFAKTSGSKGLQLYVPINRDTTYDQTKPFARAVAELLEKRHPKQVVSRMTKQLRPGKVLIDWSQNDEHKTTVSVYSLRAKERPTVSTPVTWEEVEGCARARQARRLVFDYEAVLGRVEEQGDLFAPVLTLQQDLPELRT